ncbi:MAG TPA: TOBE domain-containing protein [Candidatus Acidoferrales bacterium]|nr:TOBE domain-containing protein [Candidatus Acidoferrales bacterium]
MLDVRQAAELLHLHVKRVQSLARAGKLPGVRVGRKWLFRRQELERLLAPRGTPAAALAASPVLTISARNRLRGTVASLAVDGLMAEVTLRIGEQDLVALITRASVERLGLRVGDAAYAVIKSTEVMVGRENGRS